MLLCLWQAAEVAVEEAAVVDGIGRVEERAERLRDLVRADGCDRREGRRAGEQVGPDEQPGDAVAVDGGVELDGLDVLDAVDAVGQVGKRGGKVQ